MTGEGMVRVALVVLGLLLAGAAVASALRSRDAVARAGWSAVSGAALVCAGVTVLIVVAGCGVPVPEFPPESARTAVAPTPRVLATEDGTVVKVVDGDTLDVQIGGGQLQRIRLLGVDTPERGDCGWREATQHLIGAAPPGTPVVLTAESGQSDRDRYGRALRFVRAGERDLSSEQVMSGWAEVYRDYPVSLSPMLDVMQGHAQRRGFGVWGLCR